MQSDRGGDVVDDRVLPDRRFAVACGIAAAILLVSAVVLATPLLPPGSRTAYANVVSIPLSAAAAVCCGWTALRSRQRVRRAWALLTIACLLWAVAEVGWAIRALLHGDATSAGYDDLFYLLSIPFGIAALTQFPGRRWRGGERIRIVLDGLILGLGVFFVCRGLGVVPSGGGSLTEAVVILGYPVGDIVMLTMALILLIRANPAGYLSLGLITAAMTSYVVGDSVYALQVQDDLYAAGGPLDLTWNLSYLLFALAALAPHAATTPLRRLNTEYRVIWLPWVLIGLTVASMVAVAVASPRARADDRALVTAAIVVTVLILSRQGWVLADIAHLNQSLRGRVRDLEVASAEAQRAAAESELVSAGVVDAVVVAGEDGRIVSANQTAVRLLRLAPGPLDRRNVLDLLDASGDTDPAQVAFALALVDKRQVSQAEVVFRCDDGTSVPVEVTLGIVRRDRRHLGAVLVFRDLTARRAVERMQTEFMSVVSHELRTPLTSIRGALALLDSGVGGHLEQRGARMVHIALRSSERLSRLVNDIVDVGRLESGAIQLTQGRVEVHALIEVAVREMTAMADDAGVAVRIGESAGVVHADSDRIVQTLTNLIGNAIKFSPAGSTTTVSAVVRGVDVEFSVRDQGRGIPVDHLESVFDRFKQVDSSDSRQLGGAGLGLAICRDIVALHSGRIWALSEPGQGTEFRFTLPAATPSVLTAEPSRV